MTEGGAGDGPGHGRGGGRGDGRGGGRGGGPAAGGTGAPTLKTIARLTGLAVATVSRALGDAPDLKADTKALVRRVAEEVGYVPNRAGLRLRTGRTQVIALVMSTEHDMMNHTARLISSIAGELRATPYHLNVTPYFPGEDPAWPIRHIVATGLADAVIFNQTEPEDPRVAWLMERGFPFATHGRTAWADRHAWADYDNEAWGRIGVRRLVRAGRRRLALLAPPRGQNYARDILAGVGAAAEEAGASLRVLEGVTSDSAAREVREALALALGGAEPPDGIICSSTSSAMAAVAAIEARGLRLGRDADLFAKEAIPFLNLFRPGIMAVTEDVGRAGAVLARAAIRAIREPGAPPLQDLEVPDDDDDDDEGPPRPQDPTDNRDETT